jgi:hypothetical protein
MHVIVFLGKKDKPKSPKEKKELAGKDRRQTPNFAAALLDNG